MQFVNEFRDAELVHGVIEEIRRTVTRPWVMMEICGGQTHAIMRYGLDQLLAAGDRAGARPGLPGLRHPAGTDRQSPGDCRPARM